MVIVAAVIVFALYFYHPNRNHYESVLHLYDRLKTGVAKPTQKVELIEQIANSDDPNRERYLREFCDDAKASFVELSAAKEAQKCIRNRKTADGLYDLVTDVETKNLSNMMGATGDKMLDTVIINLKYWRYINRPDHPQFAEVEQAIANALTHRDPQQIVNVFNGFNKEE